MFEPSHQRNCVVTWVVLSQTAKTMLLGALIATAGLWIFAMTVAMGYVTFRM
jgi:hypothetical protein